MASLMNPAYTSSPPSFSRIHPRRPYWLWLVVAATGIFNLISYADESVETQTPEQNSAWDWSLLDWKTLDQLTPAQKAKIPVA